MQINQDEVKDHKNKANHSGDILDKIVPRDRLLNMCDGVFSIVMTILILDVKIPWQPDTSNDFTLIDRLIDVLPNIEVYIVSFLAIGAFWMVHHYHFHYIKHSDRNLLWINILLLMIISFIPFATDIVGDYQKSELASLIFGATLVLTWIIIYFNWRYATYNHRLVDPELEIEFINSTARRILIIASLYLIIMIVSLKNTHIAGVAYITAPLLMKFYKPNE
jgi:uncharacterized membrane protein